MDRGLRQPRHDSIRMGLSDAHHHADEEAAYREFVASGEAPPHYPVFNPLVYSLENFLPVVELHQDKYWRPIRATTCPANDEAAARAVPASSRAACCDATCGCTSWRDGRSRHCCSRVCPD